jgi:hypothetical protein
MSHFALQLIWIMVGAVFGTKLAVFIAEHIAP